MSNTKKPVSSRRIPTRTRVIFTVLLLVLGQSSTQASNLASQWFSRPVGGNVDQLKADGAFGEKIDLKTGNTRFQVTDINVRTNSGMNMSLGRILLMNRTQLEAPQSSYFAHYHPDNTWGVDPTKDTFGRSWELDVPYMTGTYDSRTGWASKASNGWGTTTEYYRCTSGFSAPVVTGVYPAYSQVFQPKDYWGGVTINIPGAGQESLLRATSEAIMPNDGLQYVGTTSSQWRASCLTTIKNGQGEGFRLVLPDGTKYYFDWMAVKNMPPLMSGGSVILSGNALDRDTISDTISPSVLLPLVKAYLYATRVEDRFGNWIEYDYDPANPFRLTAIRSNDGASILLAYNADGHIESATHAQRTWVYQYNGDVLGNHNLYRVIQPDASYWQYDGVSGLTQLFNETEDDVKLLQKNCIINIADMSSSMTAGPGDSHAITIRAPSGLTGIFKFRELVHGSSRSPGRCYTDKVWSGSQSGNSYYIATFVEGAPLLNRVASLYEREVFGLGIGSLKWSYQYEPNWSYLSQCPQTNSCATTSATVETKPNSDIVRHVFGNDYALNDGKIISIEVIRDGAVYRRTTQSYVESAQGHGFLDSYGVDPNQVSNPLVGKYRPMSVSTIVQDGLTFTNSVNSYDIFARPLSVAQANSAGYNRNEITEYHDDLNQWVLGQLKRNYVLNSNVNADPNQAGTVVVSETEFDSRSMPWKTYKFGKLQQTLTYNTNGTLATVTDGRNYATTLSNWKFGIPQQIQFPATPEAPAGATQSAVVDDNGWITATTDENGYVHGYGHDAMGRLASTIYPSGDNTAWLPKAFEFRPITASDWLPPGISVGQWRQYEGQGNYAKFTYFDAMWRPVLVHEYDTTNVNATLRSTRFGYDANGRQNFQSYPTSDVLPPALGSRTFYDALDRVVRTEQDSEHGVLTTTTEYLAGLQVRVTNPRSKQTTTGFMAWDQPGYDLPLWSSQPEGKVIEISRHPQFGWPLQVKQRSADNSVQASRQYVYDGNAQLCKTIEPETGATVMGYDGAGNPAWSAAGLDSAAYASTTDCNYAAASASARVVNRTYDARNRLTHLTFPDGKGDQIWTYENDNLPASVTAYNGAGHTDSVVTAYTYNKRRLLTGESLSQPSVYTWGVGYEYDTIGHVRWQSYPTGLKLDFAPNALGQATQARNANQSSIYYASGAEYFPNGALKQFTYGNGIVHTMTQNARQLPSRVTSTGNVLDFDYDYDENGNPTAILDLVTGTPTAQHRWMSYDGLDRLTTSASTMFGGSDQTHRFTYDALDNIESWKLAGVKDYADYVYDARNRLTNIRNTAGASVVGLGYDDQGNLANKNGQAYAFDYGNRLRNVPGKESYRYDGLGRRVQTTKADDSQTTLWQYDQSGQMLFSTDWEGSSYLNQKTHESIYLAGSLIATIDHHWPSNAVIATKYQHTDALGSPVAVTNEAGAVIERNNYEPYGAIIGNPTRSGIGYTGHVMDGATGLTYMQQRYYDQSVGRFLSIDPVTANPNTGGMFNRYNYAFDNPYRFTDPDGRAPPGCGDGSCEGPAVDTRRALEADRNSPLQPVYPETVLPLFKGIRIISQVLESLAARPSPTPVQRMSQKNDPIPQKARDVDDHAKANNGNSPAGHRGNIEFKNDGRGNGEILPKADSNGNAISYKEYDVNPFQKGVNRGAERVVRGSDGRSYYTADHYKTFTEIKPK